MCKNILHILHNSPKMAVLAPQWITGDRFCFNLQIKEKKNRTY